MPPSLLISHMTLSNSFNLSEPQQPPEKMELTLPRKVAVKIKWDNVCRDSSAEPGTHYMVALAPRALTSPF